MPRKKKPEILTVEEFVPDEGKVCKVEVTLPEHLKVDERETVEGWSATLTYFDVSCVLRERREGTIECEADWIDTRSRRRRTGTHSKAQAIVTAFEWLDDAHDRLRDIVTDDLGRPVETHQTLRLSQADAILREKGLLPGTPGSKKQAPYDRALCIARAVWPEDPTISKQNNEHIRRMFKARLLPEYWEEVFGEDPPDDLEPFEWPEEFAHRRAIGRAKPQTIVGNLADLQTALDKLVGEPNGAGGVYLEHNRLKDLEFGKYNKARRKAAGPERYPTVLQHADQAVELYRTVGRSWQERRQYEYKETCEWRTYSRHEKLDFVPGMLRYGLVTQFNHPTRPASWRRVRMDDCARTRRELVGLINSLDLREDDHPVDLSYADVWRHGAIRYRRKYSKLDTERVVPHSADSGIEYDRYVAHRQKWLERRARSDKRPEIRDSPWLFPSPRDPMSPVSEKDLLLLLTHGEAVARERVAEAGGDPDELVPELDDTAWYAYRNWWKTIRNGMGWEGNSNAAYVGDWSIKEGATADVVYARLSPHLILAVVEGLTIVEAISADAGMQRLKRAARIRPDSAEDDAKQRRSA